jgi:hypothetical protein
MKTYASFCVYLDRNSLIVYIGAKNVSEKSCREKWNTHFVLMQFFSNFYTQSTINNNLPNTRENSRSFLSWIIIKRSSFTPEFIGRRVHTYIHIKLKYN